jgi:UDP-N-acetylglucosamine transferase subunit ALG13
MIFVAVGTQLAFDRLIKYMDEWAKINSEKVIAQIAEGTYLPKHIEYKKYFKNEEYIAMVKESSIFVSHAGMGNIFTAKELKTPIIVINRQLKLNEHRNDHQADGLKWMAKLKGVHTATTKDELFDYLKHKNLEIDESISSNNSNAISNFIKQIIMNP